VPSNFSCRDCEAACSRFGAVLADLANRELRRGSALDSGAFAALGVLLTKSGFGEAIVRNSK